MEHTTVNEFTKRQTTDQSESVWELHWVSQDPGISTQQGRWGSDGIHWGQSSADIESSGATCYSSENSVHTSAMRYSHVSTETINYVTQTVTENKCNVQVQLTYHNVHKTTHSW